MDEVLTIPWNPKGTRFNSHKSLKKKIEMVVF